MQSNDEHKPVMVTEVIKGLNIMPNGIYFDGTFGRGGHSTAILEQLGKTGRLLAMDRDPSAKPYALQLEKKDARFVFQSGPFSSAYEFCKSQDVVGKLNGMLFDLGVSSPQLDSADRGFSFQKAGSLDMRMDPTSGESAKEWLNAANEEEIAEVLKKFGEERFHRRISRAIITARKIKPIETTAELAEIVAKANPAWERHKHPATRSFQAIRIHINDEMEELSKCLEQSLQLLTQNGRLVVISFHSLEDRMVKRFIQTAERGEEHPKNLPIRDFERNQKLRRVGQKQKATSLEIASNPRARSAVLRVAEKVGK